MASTSWYSQEQTPDRTGQDSELMEGISAGQRFCRLCLSKEQQLKPLFPPDGMPDEMLLQKILNCLTIALSFDEDYDSFICRICIQEVTKFFFYKEQCLTNDSILRGRRKPDKIPLYGDSGTPVGNNGALSGDEEEYDGDPIDSDEFDIRDADDDERDFLNNDQTQTGEDEDDGDDVDYEYEGEADGDNDDSMQFEVSGLKPLPKQRARRENVQDYYHGGFRYTCATSRANGKVHWRCMYKSKLKCRAAILVASDGTVTRGPNRHNHHPDSKTVPPCPASGTILDMHTGRKVSYKLINSDRSRINRMQIICNGYKFRYARTTQKQTTYWRCMKHNGKENCKAVLSFRMDFSACSSNGHGHNHPAQYDMNEPLPPNLQLPAQREAVKQPQLVIQTNGNSTSPGSSIQKGRWNVMLHKGYEFGFPRADRMNMRWACYKKSSFNCPANLYTNRGGRVIKESDWAHNHGPKDDYAKDAIIDGLMLDARTKERIPYKLIPGKRGQRFVVHNGYRYSSDRLISDGRIAWKCTKCKVFIIIGGRFGTMEDRGGEHEHEQDESDALFSYQEEHTQSRDDTVDRIKEDPRSSEDDQSNGAVDVKKEQTGDEDEEENIADEDEDLFIIP
ncbi:uncharacterized protein LOC129724959 [Wyeomyia smithii]|uniref:uncharacterized protein LOC129724959 n=1 Tax=Wyeomyia smithii TaxID=174621 RepID=UPI0024680713|nr:uncharacterized protein LOC129724959 [Wyeomyia smithii]